MGAQGDRRPGAREPPQKGVTARGSSANVASPVLSPDFCWAFPSEGGATLGSISQSQSVRWTEKCQVGSKQPQLSPFLSSERSTETQPAAQSRPRAPGPQCVPGNAGTGPAGTGPTSTSARGADGSDPALNQRVRARGQFHHLSQELRSLRGTRDTPGGDRVLVPSRHTALPCSGATAGRWSDQESWESPGRVWNCQWGACPSQPRCSW